MKMSDYSTKVTYLKDFWGCRVLYKGKPVVEGKAYSKREIGPVLRDLMRTLDKLGGDRYTHSARMRKRKEENISMSTKHYWNN
jgi:hypothetical protein